MKLLDALAARPVLKRLDRLAKAVERLSGLYEADLLDRGVALQPPEVDFKPDDDEVMYVDEERDLAREVAERMLGKVKIKED